MKTLAIPKAAEGGASKQDEVIRKQAGIDAWQYIGIAVQVALVLIVAVVYRLELERGFAAVAGLIFIGFLIHSWLPLPARVPFFLSLSIVAIAILMRGDGVWVVLIGFALIGLCHLPVPWAMNIGFVLAAAAVLAVLRTGWFDTPWAGAVIPVLGAIFMFRMILYLYDLKEDRTPATPWQRLAYFFLLPNVCFPLFPVIDYKTFLRTYYDAPAATIYQKGAFWMFRGVTHLLLYRLFYFLLPRAETDLPGLLGVYVFMAMTYGLYLRVSGLFHLIVGSLCLFGFNLPVTNNHYFLASSFNDLWRRINIYWKDFMMSTAFYPVFMTTRRWSMGLRLVIATAFVFLLTWFLHSYQWFWLQGVFPIASTDIFFWGVLGVALAANSVWEARRGRKRSLQRSEWSLSEAIGVTARTIGVFSFMAIIWSLWNSSSVGEWLHRLLQARDSGGGDLAVFAGLVVGALLAGIFVHWLNDREQGPARLEQIARRHSAVVVPTTAMLLFIVGQPQVYLRLGDQVQAVVTKAQSTSLNTIDIRRQERGYYEALSRATQFEATSFSLPTQEWVGISDTPAAELTRDIRGVTLKPNVEIVYRGATLKTNRWGLRDRDYEKTRPAATLRLALLGPSTAMGSGVENEQIFENVAEDGLNRARAGSAYDQYEILNFALDGYGALEALFLARHIVPDFDPQVVMYVIHPGETYRMIDRLRLRLKFGTRMQVDPKEQLGDEYAPVLNAIENSRPDPGSAPEEFYRRLAPYQDEILAWTYQGIVDASRQQGSTPVFVLIPLTDRDFENTERDMLRNVIRKSGGTIIELDDVFRGYDPEALRVAEWDNHPNELGHRLIGAKLSAALLELSQSIGSTPVNGAHQ